MGMQHGGRLNPTIENVINQPFSYDFHDPIAYYMVDLNNQNFRPLINCEFEDENNYELMSKSGLSLFQAEVSL